MPYHWTHNTPAAEAEPVARLHLWPHQSMTGRHFAIFIGGTVVMLAMPLLAVLGSPVAWVLLGFFFAVVWAAWYAIMKNRQERSMHEELAIWRDRMRLHHVRPARAPLEWEANPYWVSVHLHRKGGPVENYLTLRGSDREVELGAFLSPEEREALHDELTGLLARIR